MNSDYLKKFINFSVKDFDSFHQKAYPQAHERTHNSFRQGMKRLEKVYGDKLENLNLCFIKDPLDLYDKLNLSDYSHHLTSNKHEIKPYVSFYVDMKNKFGIGNDVEVMYIYQKYKKFILELIPPYH